MLPKGAQIRAARALLGWSQRDLARAAAAHVNAVRYWEQQHWRSLRLVESTSPGAKRIIAALGAEAKVRRKICVIVYFANTRKSEPAYGARRKLGPVTPIIIKVTIATA